MKTLKEKTVSKQRKNTMPKEAVVSRKNRAGKSQPSEEQIREKAIEIYNRRIEREEYGTAEEDWFEAEKQLKGTKG
jgi:hypothetical protein